MEATGSSHSGSTPSLEDVAIARVNLLRIAGVEIIHESVGLRLAPTEQEFRGEMVTAERPIRIVHRAGVVDVSAFTLALDASPATQYFVDERGEVAASLRAGEPNASEVLRTVTPGYEYEILYDPPPSDPISCGRHERTIFSIALLARRRGFLAHACGFILPSGDGVLCPGVSGVGKSTLARLLEQAGTTVLSDDRVAVTLETDGAHIWGTPWFSRARIATTGQAPLWAIGLLARGPVPVVRSVPRALALERVFAAAALPWWSATALDQSLSLLDSLFGTAQVFQLEYPLSADAAVPIVGELMDERRSHG
jgi:hypothetical protein